VEIVLVRHGLPLRVELETGIADPGLASEGHEQAEKMAAYLGVEDIEAIPGPSGLSNSTSLPAANGLGKRGIKRRIVSDDDYEEEEDEESPEVSLNVPEEEEESLEPPDLTKSLEDLTKGKALKRRDAAPPVLKAIKEEESSSEDEKPIRYATLNKI